MPASLAGLRVAFTLETFLPNVTGPAVHAWELSAALEARDVRCPVYCARLDIPENAPEEERLGPVQVHRLPSPFRIGRYAPTPGLGRLLKGADLVHCHNLRNAQTDQAWRACRSAGIPFVVHAHGGLLGYRRYDLSRRAACLYRAYDALILRRVLAEAGAVFVSSGFERRDAVEAGIPEAKIAVVPPGVRVPGPARAPERDPERPRLLFVGRLCGLRRPETLIRALAGLPGADLTLAGEPAQMSALVPEISLEGLRALARDLGVADRVHFPGLLRGEALERAYAEADVFVYPSVYESFGLPILDAAARGLPLVCTRVGVAAEILREGETGRFTDGTPEDLVRQVRALLDSRPWSAAEAWARDLQRRFSWDRAAEACLEAYGRLLSRA